MKNTKWIILGAFLIMQIHVFGQHDHPATSDHDHIHEKNEIGIANMLVYSFEEKEFAYGLHLHYVYHLPDSYFGFGLGFEKIFDEHEHNTIGAIVDLRFIDEFHFMFSPGLTLNFEDFRQSTPALHIEASYEFTFDPLHIGPILELALEKEGFHISLGLHVGFGF